MSERLTYLSDLGVKICRFGAIVTPQDTLHQGIVYIAKTDIRDGF